MAFGETLERLRRERFWTQQELAERSGVARQTIYRYERERVAPLGRNVRALASALGVEPAELAAPEEIARTGRKRRPLGT